MNKETGTRRVPVLCQSSVFASKSAAEIDGGLSRGLSNCPPDSLMPSQAKAALFESLSPKEKHPDGVPLELVRVKTPSFSAAKNDGGLSRGLSNCPPDSLMPSQAKAALFESLSPKEKHPDGVPFLW